jgi:hypothetical protein
MLYYGYQNIPCWYASPDNHYVEALTGDEEVAKALAAFTQQLGGIVQPPVGMVRCFLLPTVGLINAEYAARAKREARYSKAAA